MGHIQVSPTPAAWSRATHSVFRVRCLSPRHNNAGKPPHAGERAVLPPSSSGTKRHAGPSGAARGRMVMMINLSRPPVCVSGLVVSVHFSCVQRLLCVEEVCIMDDRGIWNARPGKRCVTCRHVEDPRPHLRRSSSSGQGLLFFARRKTYPPHPPAPPLFKEEPSFRASTERRRHVILR